MLHSYGERERERERENEENEKCACDFDCVLVHASKKCTPINISSRFLTLFSFCSCRIHIDHDGLSVIRILFFKCNIIFFRKELFNSNKHASFQQRLNYNNNNNKNGRERGEAEQTM